MKSKMDVYAMLSPAKTMKEIADKNLYNEEKFVEEMVDSITFAANNGCYGCRLSREKINRYDWARYMHGGLFNKMKDLGYTVREMEEGLFICWS